MKLLDYIKGQRKGKDAHRIEKDSMKDPFLYEALEGFDSIKDNHIERINYLQNRLRTQPKKKPIISHILQIAAVFAVIIFGLGGYLFIDYHKADLHARNMDKSSIIEIYVPEAYYVENITIVAKKNVDFAKAYKPNISQFKVNPKVDHSISQEEMDILLNEEMSKNTIEIYIPEDFENLNPKPANNDKPVPVIGLEKYNLYLKQNLRRPTDDACRNRKGNVYIDFSVNEHGQPYSLEVVQSLCGTCDNEAVRLIESGPKWIPGTKRARVKVEF
jgi:Gram-negative bacterial tonB protein.